MVESCLIQQKEGTALGDSDRSPQIQLEIDQEVFIDSVSDGDVVEDATVATEVTLFDRVGDAYVLEGAIVFAGYTKNSASDESDNADEAADALSLGMDISGVNHLHHRLPFILRVPVKAQPRGIVNVNSRISSWRLEVIGAGWIRILGDLTVIGLNGDKGYHFECGAQEEGDLLFQQQSAQGSEAYEDVYEVDDPPAADASGELHSEELQLTRGSEDDMDVTPAYEDTNTDELRETRSVSESSDAEAISDARGGQEMAETGSAESSQTDEGSGDFSSSELHRLDRLFGSETSSIGSTGQEETTSPSGEASSYEESKPYSAFSQEHRRTVEAVQEDEQRTSAESDNVVEFDFEHQVPDVGAVQGQEVQAESHSNHYTLESDRADGETTDVVMGESEGEGDTRAESVSMSTDMWSFVDFDGPDTKYTLRFVIAEDEESLEDLSVRLNCSPDDLVRMNHLTRDTVVHPGQSLAVPESEEQQEA